MATSKVSFNTIDEYISSFPPQVRQVLQALRQTITEAVPDAAEAIKYGMPTFTLHGNLVYFAAWTRHIGLYPITSAMAASIKELSNYTTSGKGTIRFPLDQPLPMPLIRQIVAFRVQENIENSDQNK